MASSRATLPFVVCFIIGQCSAATGQDLPISKLAFGSCIKESHATPILETIRTSEPDVFIFLGDNIYADTEDMQIMREKYAKLRAQSGFAELLNSCRVLATWDDHDYGVNDGGADYKRRAESQQIFLEFWNEPKQSPRLSRPGVYEEYTFGPPGKRIQVILLDTRYFRGPLKTGERRVGGPYVPAEDKDITMLGDAQWKWLEQRLLEPSDLRIIASSIQCVAEDSGQETWSNLPHERQRLFDLIGKTGADGVLLISGDRHWAELSLETVSAPYPIYDLTSSSLNQVHERGTPTDNRFRAIPTTYHRENFGEIEVEWGETDPLVHLRILDHQREVKIEKTLSLSELSRDAK